MTNAKSLQALRNKIAKTTPELFALIYTVGECGPGQFMEEVSTSLMQCEESRLRHYIDVHGIGYFNAVKTFFDMMKPQSHIIAISSIVTSLAQKKLLPPQQHSAHYAGAKALQDQYTYGLRRDPRIMGKKILVHRIAPTCVDTPFREGSPSEFLPPEPLPLDVIPHSVSICLYSTSELDIELSPFRF